MTLPEAYQSQVQNIHASPKFQLSDCGHWQANPFPGYTVITPPWVEATVNEQLYAQLQTFQTTLLKQLPDNLVAPVPPDSLHLTLADLIWQSAYSHASENPTFESQLRDRITQSFQQYQLLALEDTPIRWQLLGLMVMPRAIGVCLAPRDESSYARVLALRRAIYQNSALMALGIEQQYHFTAHITLGYFGDVEAIAHSNSVSMPALAESLSHIFTALNEYWLTADAISEFRVDQAELRKFDDMTRYYREPKWPVLKF
ncbi:MAG: DUF1868 domain-containing protein [Cyanothece sp. SIO1E1]|nr:DUF1868 domain-containing protein [Cyanothece sp. SIO1E1]